MVSMALFLWEFEEEAIAKALIAVEINSGLLRRSRMMDLQDEIERSLNNNGA